MQPLFDHDDELFFIGLLKGLQNDKYVGGMNCLWTPDGFTPIAD